MANGQIGSVLRYVRHLVGRGETGDQTDGELLDRFCGRQEAAAFESLVQRHASVVWSVCRRILADEHAAEDVFQATFLVLVKKAATLDRRGSLANWLYTVAYHLALKSRTRALRHQTLQADDMASPDCTDTRQELHTALDEELQRLPEKYRRPLVLCYFQGKTNEEAARELGQPAGSMSRHMTRGRELLRERLAHRGVALASTAVAATLSDSVLAVPPRVIAGTVEAGLRYAAGKTAVGALSAEAVGLAEGMLRGAAVSHLKVLVAMLVAVGLLGTGAGVWAYQTFTADTPVVREEAAPASALSQANDGGLAATVEQNVALWQPTPDERRIDEVGWATDVRHALALAKAHNRPIFIYILGGRIELGRCCGGASGMRASGLSNRDAIDLLNRRFIPLFLASEDYAKAGKATKEEKEAYQSLRRDITRAGLFGGTNLAVVLSAEGQVIDSYHGCHIAKASELVAWLLCHATDSAGPPVVKPTALSRAPAHPGDAVALHLTARYLQREGSRLVPIPTRNRLGRDGSSGFNSYPAESWIVLDRKQCQTLLPAADAIVGASWVIDPGVTSTIFVHCYPPTDNNDLGSNRIDRASLKATVVATSSDRIRVRLEGGLRMMHRIVNIPEKYEETFVDADLLGYLDVDPSRQRILSLRLMTPRATYGKDNFGLAIRSVP